MPSPNSLASLSRLSSLQAPGGRAGFPGDEDPAQYDEARMGDAVEAETGLNPTGMHERALADLADHLDNLDFQKRNRQNTLRRQDSEFLGPEGWARSSPEDAQHARDLQFGDERIAHEAANLPTMLRMGHETALAHGKDVSDVYWQPGTESMREDTSRRTNEANRLRYLDPVLARDATQENVADINASGRVSAAATTANGRSKDVAGQILGSEIGALLHRGDVNPNDPDSIAKALNGFLSLRNGAASSGVPGGSGPAAAGGAPSAGPDLSGLAPGHGRTFQSGEFAGQTWTVDAQGKPARVK